METRLRGKRKETESAATVGPAKRTRSSGTRTHTATQKQAHSQNKTRRTRHSSRQTSPEQAPAPDQAAAGPSTAAAATVALDLPVTDAQPTTQAETTAVNRSELGHMDRSGHRSSRAEPSDGSPSGAEEDRVCGNSLVAGIYHNCRCPTMCKLGRHALNTNMGVVCLLCSRTLVMFLAGTFLQLAGKQADAGNIRHSSYLLVVHA